MRNLGTLSVVVLLLSLGGTVDGFPLIYEEGPKAGQVYSGTGPIYIQMRDFDMGTVYGQQPLGTVLGGEPTSAADVASKVAAVDAVAGQTAARGAIGNEDSWGIARVDNISDADGFMLWTQAVKQAELTFMFWGERDFRVEQINASVQRISGTGMQFKMYEDTSRNYNPTQGSTGRTSEATYATATDGQLVLSGHSVSGFIHDVGQFGGAQTQFQADFNQSSRTGMGEAFFAIDGGAMAPVFDSNFFQSSVIDPDASQTAGQFFAAADLRIKFTTTPSRSADWLVTSFDPGELHLVPEPATLTLLGLGFGLLATARKSRRR